MAQFEFVDWLVQWLFSQVEFQFAWDEGNATKSALKHGIEQVFQNQECLAPLGIQVKPKANEPRFGAFGMDLLGKQLFVSFAIREGRIRVISIRPMNKTERKKYASLRQK